MTDLRYKADEIFMLTEGEYADFQVVAMLRAAVDFDAREVADQFAVQNPDAAWRFQADQFLDYLVENHLVEVIPYRAMYVGAYGRGDLPTPPKIGAPARDPEALAYEEYDQLPPANWQR
jgi:hypothetical protein